MSEAAPARWKYKTFEVKVDGNSQTVRMLTAGERRQFAALSSKKKAGEATGADLANSVLLFATVNPNLSLEDIEAMPPDLYEACTHKVMELTGLHAAPGAEVPEGGEKKAPTEAQLNS